MPYQFSWFKQQFKSFIFSFSDSHTTITNVFLERKVVFDDVWDMMGGEQQPPPIKWMNWKRVFETIYCVVCGRSVDSVQPRLGLIGYEWGGMELVFTILKPWLMVKSLGCKELEWSVIGIGDGVGEVRCGEIVEWWCEVGHMVLSGWGPDWSYERMNEWEVLWWRMWLGSGRWVCVWGMVDEWGFVSECEKEDDGVWWYECQM